MFVLGLCVCVSGPMLPPNGESKDVPMSIAIVLQLLWVSHFELTLFLHCLRCRTHYGNLGNMTLSTKPEVHSVLQHREGWIEAPPQAAAGTEICRCLDMWFLRYDRGKTDPQTCSSQYRKI